MNQSTAPKFTTQEIIAIALSTIIILIGVGYWLYQGSEAFDLLNAAYDLSVIAILGRLLLILLGVAVFLTAVIFAQKRFNK